MKIEVREDSVVITGYVNAIERFSKPIKETLRGKVRTFIERIKAGVFKTALKRNDNVLVLLNHNQDRVVANTKDGSAKLEEDNIGLRAEVTITDQEVVEKARNNKLVGWSFGFIANDDELGTDGDNETRTITDLDLIEVSILDDTKSPAYYGTSIEARSEDKKVLEIRTSIEEIEMEAQEKHKKVYEETYGDADKKHTLIEIEKEEAKMELLAELVANKIIEKMNNVEKKEEVEEDIEETSEEEPEVQEDEKRNIDYSDFEERIAKFK